MNPLVSVIIPVYNVRKYLDACLESVLNQTYRNTEIIIINDGSTDGSDAICENFRLRYPDQIVYICQPNGGLSIARNSGLSIAKGDYIMFVDSDDTIIPDAVCRLVDIQKRTNADIVITNFTKSGNGTIHIQTPHDTIREILNQTARYTHTSWGKLYSAELFSNGKNRFKPGIIYEDLEFFPRVLDDCNIIAYADTLIYRYTIRQESLTNNPILPRTDIIEITKTLQEKYSADKSLIQAAVNRRFAANFNIFFLTQDDRLRDECWNTVRELRWNVISNNKARLKNRIGALISYLGKGLLKTIFKHKLNTVC